MRALPELFRLDGRVAVVTGGTAWLGRDIAETLAAAGARIVVTSRQAARAEAVAAEIARVHGVDALGLPLDQRDFASVEAMARDALEWRGRVDVLVNNAGGGSGTSPGALFERDPAAMAEMIAVNLTGALWCARELARPMARAGSGKIVSLASVAALVGRDRRMYRNNAKEEQPVDYAAAKAGLLGMTRDLAAALAPHGLQVNAISPGGFDKGDLPDGFVRDYARATPAGRMGRFGADIRGAALFLAAPASDYVTGQNLVVDGGFSAVK